MMQDPMAGMDAAPAAADGEPGAQTLDVATMRYQLHRLDRLQNMLAIAAGCVAGILGLTGVLAGLACFFGLHFLVLAILYVYPIGIGRLYETTRMSVLRYLTTGVQACALSFTLFWTLLYGLVYLY